MRDSQHEEGQLVFAQYSEFSLHDLSDNFRLSVSGYDVTSTAGDALVSVQVQGFSHSGMAFSTKDRDLDVSWDHCAQDYRGAWWFHICHNSHLNGMWGVRGNAEGLIWYGPPLNKALYLNYSLMKVKVHG